MAKNESAASKPKSKPKPQPTDEVPWTIRLPYGLIEKLDARVEELNEIGRGKWSRNGLAVFLLTKGADDPESGK